MKPLCIVLFFIWLGFPTSAQGLQGYFEVYRGESSAALRFYKEKKRTIDSIFVLYHIPSALGFSIVAPEVGHFSLWRNRMETTTTELFYVELGTDYGDFSIGPFQIKPTFAERVENEITALALREFSLLKYNTTDPRIIRQERVERLSDFRWQLHYLCAFLRIVEEREQLQLNVARLEDVAIAYNAGFWVSPQIRAQLKNKEFFPSRFGQAKFPYARIVSEYYIQLMRHGPK